MTRQPAGQRGEELLYSFKMAIDKRDRDCPGATAFVPSIPVEASVGRLLELVPGLFELLDTFRPSDSRCHNLLNIHDDAFSNCAFGR